MKKRETITICRRPRMAGLSAAAARLGVSRTQLREVVLGNRQSKRLMARIRAARERAMAVLAFESDALDACAKLRRLPPLPA